MEDELDFIRVQLSCWYLEWMIFLEGILQKYARVSLVVVVTKYALDRILLQVLLLEC